MLKRWLDDKGIEYTDYLVDQNPYAAQNMVQQSGQRGVPFTTIEHDDGRTDKIVGFNREAFNLALAQ